MKKLLFFGLIGLFCLSSCGITGEKVGDGVTKYTFEGCVYLKFGGIVSELENQPAIHSATCPNIHHNCK